VREQAVRALGNIAGDSPQCRDLVLEANALQVIYMGDAIVLKINVMYI
jgi:hypothetical protein